MSEDPIMRKETVYRGVTIWFQEPPGQYWYFLDNATQWNESVERAKDRIDEALGLEVAEVEEPAIITPDQNIGTIKGFEVWYNSVTDEYRAESISGVFPDLVALRRAIDLFLEPEEVITDEDEIPSVLEPRGVTLPALPWYASWLEPIIIYIGTLTEGVVNYFAPIFKPIGDMADSLLDLPSKIIVGFVESAGSLLQAGRDKGTGIAVDTLADVVEGSPAWMGQLSKSIEALETQILSTYNEAIQIETYEKSMLSGVEAIEALGELKSSILSAAIANFGLHALVEAGSLGQMEFMKELDSMVVAKFGLSSVIERATMLPLEKGILVPAEQEYFKRYPHTIPGASQLIEMVVKEVIPLDEFKANMLKLGFTNEWSQFIWDAHFIPPNFDQILRAFYRGVITREELETLKILVDLDPRFNEIWDAQIEVIPPYQELVNQRVKEVISQEDFEKYLQWHGFGKEWADRIWLASKIPPSLGDLLTSWRRGEITEDRLDELMIIVDLDPRYKDIFDTRKYNDPSITVARYMFETGAIDEERVAELVARAGFMPEDIEPITQFIVRFQERRFRTFYLRALQSGIVAGAYTPEELTEEVVAAGYTEATAEWMIKTAEVRKNIQASKVTVGKPRILTVADLKKSYMTDLITEDEMRRELGVRGYETGDIEILIELMNMDKEQKVIGPKVVALSVSQILNAWRYEVITEDEAKIELSLRGLDETEIYNIMETKKRQWGLTT